MFLTAMQLPCASPFKEKAETIVPGKETQGFLEHNEATQDTVLMLSPSPPSSTQVGMRPRPEKGPGISLRGASSVDNNHSRPEQVRKPKGRLPSPGRQNV